MSGDNILKLEQATKIPITQALTYLTYLKDKNRLNENIQRNS